MIRNLTFQASATKSIEAEVPKRIWSALSLDWIAEEIDCRGWFHKWGNFGKPLNTCFSTSFSGFPAAPAAQPLGTWAHKHTYMYS